MQGQPNPTDFATGFFGVTDTQVGPDGALYFLRIFGTLERIEGHGVAVTGTPTPGSDMTFGYANESDAGRSFLCGFALTHLPGAPLPNGGRAPINIDALFLTTLTIGPPLIVNNFGVLDGAGAATTQLHLPDDPLLVGIPFCVGFLVFEGDEVVSTSQAAPFVIQ